MSLLDGSVTAMCCSPVRHHLAVGLKSGKVKIFVGDPSQSAPVPFTIPDTKVPIVQSVCIVHVALDCMGKALFLVLSISPCLLFYRVVEL